VIFQRLADAIKAERLGPAASGLTRLKIELNESHLARAAFEAPI